MGAGCALPAEEAGEVLVKVNTDFSTKGLDSQEVQAVVAAWQAGVISRDTMFELFRKGEILPDGRTNQDEARLVEAGNPKSEVRRQLVAGRER